MNRQQIILSSFADELEKIAKGGLCRAGKIPMHVKKLAEMIKFTKKAGALLPMLGAAALTGGVTHKILSQMEKDRQLGRHLRLQQESAAQSQ